LINIYYPLKIFSTSHLQKIIKIFYLLLILSKYYKKVNNIQKYFYPFLNIITPFCFKLIYQCIPLYPKTPTSGGIIKTLTIKP